MPSLDMRGPFELSVRTIDREVTRAGPGNYALGHLNKNGAFVVRRVGRSDTDIKGDLKAYVGKYKRFKFSSATDLAECFVKHCRNFHDFLDKLDDQTHPTGSGEGACPICASAAA